MKGKKLKIAPQNKGNEKILRKKRTPKVTYCNYQKIIKLFENSVGYNKI